MLEILMSLSSTIAQFPPLLSSNITTLLQSLIIALLTILIPLAIGVLADILFLKHNNSETANLDRHLFVDSVFPVKRLIVVVIGAFVGIALLDSSSQALRLMALVLLTVSLFLMIRIIIILYQWARSEGKKWDFRFKYLSSHIDHRTLIEVFEPILNSEHIAIENKERLYEIFSKKVNSIIISDKASALQLILLIETSKEIDLKILSGKVRLFSNLLSWNETIISSTDDSHPFGLMQQIETIWSRLIRNEHSYAYSYVLFKAFSDHLRDKNIDYIERISHNLFLYLFKNYDREINIFKSWPKEWLITKSSYRTNTNRVIFSAYIEVAIEIIEKGEPAYNFDDLTRKVFPVIDPITWGKMLFFAYSSGFNQPILERIESYISRRRPFGLFGRSYSGAGEDFDPTDRINNGVNEALLLVKLLLSPQININNWDAALDGIDTLAQREPASDGPTQRLLNLQGLRLVFEQMKALQ